MPDIIITASVSARTRHSHFPVRVVAEEKYGFEPASHAESRIALPFIVISTPSETVIQCEMSEGARTREASARVSCGSVNLDLLRSPTDRADVFFNFNAPFEIYDDNAILQKLRLQVRRLRLPLLGGHARLTFEFAVLRSC
jgi:hypothetical protein